jgi:hypothetical protein
MMAGCKLQIATCSERSIACISRSAQVVRPVSDFSTNNEASGCSVLGSHVANGVRSEIPKHVSTLLQASSPLPAGLVTTMFHSAY